jgi:hypothetical protein
MHKVRLTNNTKIHDEIGLSAVAIVKEDKSNSYKCILHPHLWKLRRRIDDRIEPILIERDFDDANFF